MKVKITFLCLCMSLLTSISVSADPITREQAQKQAEQYLNKVQGGRPRLSPVVNRRKLAPKKSTSVRDLYYVFNRGDNEGFVLVAGDDRVDGVIGYTDSGDFDYNEIPDNMRSWLEAQERQIQYIQDNPGVATADVPTHKAIAEMLTTRWNQNAPYNDLTPRKSNGAATATGCVATAMAQVLYFQRAKSVDELQATIPAYTSWTQQLQVASIPEGSPIDWKNMLDTYGSSATGIQRTAVAQLMKYCGAAVHMDYDDSSGAQPSEVPGAFNTYFGYTTARIVWQSDYDATGWDALLYNELANGRVCYLGGYNKTAGHAFVCDGYDGAGCFHINWGWGGASNGHFKLTALTPGQQGIGGSEDGSGFTDGQNAVIGCEPTDYSTKELVISNTIAKKVCLDNWDANGDGKFTYGEAAAVTDLGDAFKGKRISTFEEFSYFTGLTAIGEEAFSGCTSLTSINLPKKLKVIGDRAFQKCSKLKKLALPASLQRIGDFAFDGCKVLANLELPGSLSSIGTSAFESCAAFTSVELPFSVQSLGDRAFASCSKLTSVTIQNPRPQSLTLGMDLFDGVDISVAKLNIIQGTRVFFSTTEPWMKFGIIHEMRNLSQGNFDELVTNKDYYIYNIGTGKYLTRGEAYGTQAVVGEEPMRFQLKRSSSMNEGVYYLYTNDNDNTDRHWLFRTSNDARVGKGIKACFTDDTKLSTSAYWKVENIGDQIYTFQIPSNFSDYVLGEYFGVQLDHDNNNQSPTNGVFSDVSYVNYPRNCQWAFVPYDKDAVDLFKAAQVLGKLLSTATSKKLSVASEQAVFDNMESTMPEIEEAQYKLRQKLGYVNFKDPAMRTICLVNWDTNEDGEVSYGELASVKDVNVTFQSNTSVVNLEDLQYFTGMTAISANSFQKCTKVTNVKLPNTVTVIDNYAFDGCSKLKSIELPENIYSIGTSAFRNCSSLMSLTVCANDPAEIQLNGTVFTVSNVQKATLYVPFGSKTLYEEAAQWKDFGEIKEARTHIKPAYSPIEPNVQGYIYNLGQHKFITNGEAYGTQAVVGTPGLIYQFKPKSATNSDGIYALATLESKPYLFRTSTDTKIGEGVKGCFYDGSSMGATSYWQITQAEGAAENVFTMQVPSTDATYVEGEYLGVVTDHISAYTSPTYGLYWDVVLDEGGAGCQWAFIRKADVEAAAAFNALGDRLKALLAIAISKDIDVTDEQFVYDNPEATENSLTDAIKSVCKKLGFITFADDRAEAICINEWDTDHDGYFSMDEAAAVKDIGTVFNIATGVKSIDELRYFTGLTSLPSYAFRNSSSLVSLYIPAGVSSIGEKVFNGCSNLKYVAVLSETVPDASTAGITMTMTFFVPSELKSAYESDEIWSKATILEYTGKPVVTAHDDTRSYGVSNKAFLFGLTGAPINGIPSLTCEADVKSSVGEYPIVGTSGSITTPDVQYVPGTLSITKATLKITARDATREMGQENPEFLVRYNGWKNGDKESCLLALPITTCEADINSPAGEYEITVSGAEAENYEFNYVSGTLTITVPVGISQVKDDEAAATIFDLSGRKVLTPKRGVYIVDGKKRVVTK